MPTPSPRLQSLLMDLRQHPAFPELVKAVEMPKLPRFKRSQAQAVEAERSNWIFQSGKREQHESWLALLTGQKQENDSE